MGGFETTLPESVPSSGRGSSQSSYSEDDVSVSSGSSSSSSSVSHMEVESRDGTAESESAIEFAKTENQKVRVWRYVVFIVLLITGVIITLATYLFLDKSADADHQETYTMYTKTIVETSADNMVKFKTVIRGVADSVTIAGLKDHTVPSIFSDIPRSFPYVRVPQFEVVAAEARQLSASESIVWTPFVDDTQRNAWANFASLNANGPNGWLNESRQALAKHPDDHYFEDKEKFVEGNISQVVFRLTDEGDMEEVKGPGIMAPLWQMSPPPPDSSLINYDLMDETQVPPVIPVLNATRQGFFLNIDPDLGRKVSLLTPSNDGHDEDHPHSTFVQPVLSSYESNATLVGFVAAIVSWDDFLSRLVPDGINGIVAVLRNSCGDIRTYVLKGRTAEYVGPTDMHDSDYDDTEVVVTLTDFSDDIDGQCDYSVHLYSSSEYDNTGNSNLPVICTIIVGCIFLLMGITFFIYDRFVTRRNDKVIEAAAHSNKIISTLFPAQVRDRLFAEKEQNAKRPTNLKSMLTNGNFLDTRKDEDDDVGYKSKPIADLFPETTILFADISGFTAWSSVREPAQVFVLLETLFRAFDDIAKKRRVFKVETVGDCYVAVTGLPEPRKDHAVAMCRFARDCLLKMRVLAKKLEVTLGPDTGDLAMRMGIHSGAVTAGVLRGERSRFQLFGDTMNTAARMEHTGIRDRIQLSQETADLLIAAGKSNWIAPRNDIIVAKGKGEMQTYWLELTNRAGDGVSTTDASSNGSASVCGEVEAPDMTGVHDAKTMRLIDWNVDVLLRLLKQIVARRNACPPVEGLPPYEARFSTENGSSTIDEVREIIKLPRFNKAAAMKQEDPENVVLDPKVAQQLHSYVCNIAAIYRENPFHNFEHASHVTMSVVKLLSRIVAPQDLNVDENADSHQLACCLHDHTYGITSDAMTQFACVFSALIHDCDHSGVPNAQLVIEGAEVANYYKNKSVAEQNSVDLAWNLLMDDDYKYLRATIYQTDAELRRFRQLVVNSVMATDIVDKDLKAIRNLRWDRAFSESTQDADPRDTVNRKATIVIEHLIQASDVAHTMQHWHIYRKWNERFFMECYQGYLDGRAAADPSESWYKGEIGFFDFYIIPLAKKLKNCGVFGVSSDEYLQYAQKNRQEWETRGQEVVNEMLQKAQQNLHSRKPRRRSSVQA